MSTIRTKEENNFKRLMQIEKTTVVAPEVLGGSFECDRRIAIHYMRELCLLQSSTEGKSKYLKRPWFERGYRGIQLFDRLYETIGPSEENIDRFIKCCFNGRFNGINEEIERKVNPFSYVEFLNSVVEVPTHDLFFQKLYRVIWKCQDDIAFTMKFRPSVVAIAAVTVFISKEYTSQTKNFETFVQNLDSINPSILAEIGECKRVVVDLYDELPDYAAAGAAGMPEELGSCGMADISPRRWTSACKL